MSANSLTSFADNALQYLEPVDNEAEMEDLLQFDELKKDKVYKEMKIAQRLKVESILAGMLKDINSRGIQPHIRKLEKQGLVAKAMIAAKEKPTPSPGGASTHTPGTPGKQAKKPSAGKAAPFAGLAAPKPSDDFMSAHGMERSKKDK